MCFCWRGGGTKVETTSSLPHSVAEMGFLMASTTEAGSRVGCSTDEVVVGGVGLGKVAERAAQVVDK